jgi:hypothetical protein
MSNRKNIFNSKKSHVFLVFRAGFYEKGNNIGSQYIPIMGVDTNHKGSRSRNRIPTVLPTP